MNITPELVALGVIWYVVFLFSLTCHEGAHALVAKWGGDPTAFHGGQVTLNPLPHMQREPFGTILAPIVTYALMGWMMGWASAPYDPNWQARYPRRAAWMALAGPAANFILMLIAAIAIRIGMVLGHFQPPQTISFTRITEAADPGALGFLATFLSILFLLNLVLGLFNLLPVPPLDGHTGITLLMSPRAALRWLEWFRDPSFGFMGILIAWLVFGRIFRFVFPLALKALYPEVTYG
jgi:Zn-dependent protease